MKTVNDAQQLSQDPTFRLIGSERIWERGAALTSRFQSFETEVLARGENLAGLEGINRDFPAPAEKALLKKLAGALHAEAIRCTLPVGREVNNGNSG